MYDYWSAVMGIAKFFIVPQTQNRKPDFRLPQIHRKRKIRKFVCRKRKSQKNFPQTQISKRKAFSQNFAGNRKIFVCRKRKFANANFQYKRKFFDSLQTQILDNQTVWSSK